MICRWYSATGGELALLYGVGCVVQWMQGQRHKLQSRRVDVYTHFIVHRHRKFPARPYVSVRTARRGDGSDRLRRRDGGHFGKDFSVVLADTLMSAQDQALYVGPPTRSARRRDTACSGARWHDQDGGSQLGEEEGCPLGHVKPQALGRWSGSVRGQGRAIRRGSRSVEAQWVRVGEESAVNGIVSGGVSEIEVER
jgi:hypothetical protein